MPKYLETSWSVDDAQRHEIEVLHLDLPVRDMDEAAERQRDVLLMTLLPGGTLLCQRQEITVDIPEHCVTIRAWTRPPEQRPEPFLPDMTTEEGRARIKATLTDPAYTAAPEEFQVVRVSLAELAALPGAAGRLGSLAYGTADHGHEPAPLPSRNIQLLTQGY